ncbi:hypothetical protein [Nocardiopsis algeriensis]|uniref:Uncharacterized protein n=1 Tax=Nocardiopsis algeriensis TaxID=1478215 RepID=A0A841J005_9ACTN|nr:hypothetical protein [Nocardiopsis algeriensis]MBB6121701.1 hypothetical protein [Nocardiopsis algeriensis]
MAHHIERAVHPTRSPQAGRTVRTPEEALRLSGVAAEPVHVPRPREDADTISSQHPIMHWVLVTDENGRTRPEARWL